MSPKLPSPLTGFSIRTNVILLTLVPMLAISFLVSGVFVVFRIGDLNEALNNRGYDLARHLAGSAEFGVITGNSQQLTRLVSDLLQEPNIRAAAIFDKNRRLLVQSGPVLLDPPTLVPSMSATRSLLQIDDVLRFAEPILFADVPLPESADIPGQTTPPNPYAQDKRLLGWAIIEIKRSNTQLAIFRTVLIALLTTFVSAFLSILLARHLADRLSLPLAAITQAISEIKDGQLNTRVESQAGPEIELLEEGVNALAEALERLRNEMQQNIDQATEDLRETLETIEIQNIELDIARKDALEASRVKSEFLANMSHEIRTPLNGILGFTKLLLKGHLNRQQRDQLNTILKSSEILLTIINDILDFSKIEAGKLVLDFTTLNLQEVVDDVLTMLAPTAHEKNLDLAALIYSDVPNQIYGDPLRLKQILTNLVNNAIKFTQRGEVMVRVMLEEEDEQGRPQIRLSVTDTGVGLSRLQQQNLFTPFSQADASTARRYGGTGLGLVISRRLVEQMGGKIGVDSELGKGASFWVNLPITLNEQQESETDETSGTLHNERVIYLEHQEKTALVVESMLAHWGGQVERVANMADLIERVVQAQQKNRGYAMAIVGLSQTQLYSVPYAQSIRSLEYKLDCRTLLLLPTLDPTAETPAVVADASATLTKPPTRRRLADTVITLLNGRPHVPLQIAPSARPLDARHAPAILAVDDNTANLKLILALLDELKVKCEGVSSGYEALQAVRRQTFGLIFMDVQMPGMDGIETTAKIREIEGGNRHTPIVALTAHALAEETQMLMNSGFDDYLTKPVDEQQLCQVIERHTGYQSTLSSDRATDMPATSTIKPSSRKATEDCVDILAGIRLAGGKPDLAEELFSMLIESLPDARHALSRHMERQALQPLLEEVHKLHGATRYCGVPALRQAAATLETALKKNNADWAFLVEPLLNEIDRIEYWAERNEWQGEFRKAHPTRPN